MAKLLFMQKKSFFKIVLLLAIAFPISCRNDQSDKKMPDATKAAVDNFPDSSKKSDSAGLKKNDAANMREHLKKTEKEDHTTAENRAKKADNKIKEKTAARSDSSAAIKNNNPTDSKNDNGTLNNTVNSQSTNKPANIDAADKPFVAKYGIIPRDANENSLTVFFNTFPDKQTLIKVNFDAPPDNEMNSVKTRIIKVLKKKGYV